MTDNNTRKIAEYYQRLPVSELDGFLQSVNKTGDELLETIATLRERVRELTEALRKTDGLMYAMYKGEEFYTTTGFVDKLHKSNAALLAAGKEAK